MRLSTFIAWLLGVALLVGLVAVNDPAEVLRAVARLRYWRLLAILFHAVPLWFDVVAGQRRFAAPPRLSALLRIRWIARA